MSELKLLCLDGDGIGPEIMSSTLNVVDAIRPLLSKELKVERRSIGFASLNAHGTTISSEVLEQSLWADGIILGPVSHNDYPPLSEGGKNPSGVLRKKLDLYANIRPAKLWDGVVSPINKPIDLVIIRENTEGFYSDRNMYEGSGEYMPTPDLALATRKITTQASERIAIKGFEIAQSRKIKKVTAVHKANVMRLSDGLFLRAVRDVAAQFPDVEYNEMLVDSCAAHLVRNPEQFDVMLTTNMFGDILSDLASELSGGLGVAGSLNLGNSNVMAQAQHGSAPEIAGENLANPVSLILSTEMLFRHLGELKAADAIRQAIATTLSMPETRTQDLKGLMGTIEYTKILLKTIDKQMQ